MRGIQKVCSLIQLTTEYEHDILSASHINNNYDYNDYNDDYDNNNNNHYYYYYYYYYYYNNCVTPTEKNSDPINQCILLGSNIYLKNNPTKFHPEIKISDPI